MGMDICLCAWREQELGRKVPLPGDVLAALARSGRPHCVQVLAALLQSSMDGTCVCCDASFGFAAALEMLLERSTTGPLPVRVQGLPQQELLAGWCL
jgi:hypothetical protein